MYRYLPTVINRVFPVIASQADREYVLTPSTVSRVYEPAQYVEDAVAVQQVAGVPVDLVVHVESHWRTAGSGSPSSVGDEESSLDETRYVSSLPFGVSGAPRLGAVVAHVDPRASNCAEQLERHAEVTDRLRGIRWSTARHPDPRVRAFAEREGILSSPAFLDGFATIAQLGLTFDAWCYSHQIYDVAILAQHYPESTIILDHMGAAVGVFGPVGSSTGMTAAARADIMKLWRERITMLAANGNVMVKLSGLALPILGYGRDRWGNIGDVDTLANMIGPLVEHVVEQFGPDRVIFGSNYPIDAPNASLDTLVQALLSILSVRGDHLLRNLFRDNARRVYKM